MKQLDDITLLAAFSDYQRGRAFSTHTVRRRLTSLNQFSKSIRPKSLAEATLADCEDWLLTFAIPRTRHAYRSDLVVFYDWACRREFLKSNPTELLDRIKVPQALPRPAPDVVIAEAFSKASADVQLALMLGALAGLRVGEMARLSSTDVHLEADPPVLLVRAGKGNKDRVVPLHPTLVGMLRGRTGWLFASPKGGHVTPNYIGRVLGDALTAAGDETLTAHTLRHRFGTTAASVSRGNLLAVAALMGHANMQTTVGYVAWSQHANAEIVAAMTAPKAPEEATVRHLKAVGS